MESFAEEMISTYLSRLLSPGLLLIAAISVVILMSGLGAKIVEVGQAVGQALTGGGATTGPSPLSSDVTIHDIGVGERP